MPRIHVHATTHRELELIALAWNTTVADALARLIADVTNPATDRAHGAAVVMRQGRKPNR